MRFKTLMAVWVAGFVVVGCNETVLEETHTVEWYTTNKAQRLEKLEECSNNPGELGETPNCKNAQEAKRISMKGESTTRF
jgi:hypothetical protein